ncbi:hypothetical protein QF031_000820 [Pseudarthrobacter defluvii]|uniref:hypothetical protein n=1 Tax=Pseudarthrobacter defluvii TaxID=410837 RepID=UPI0027840DC4|nr:hypothetical protein [Pseudarthrobacter defluvii]MDQ0768071.1 hypothetical protein [Pseudarthrobacter defluvii]
MIKAICQYEGAAITGKRWGSRVLGIGFDSMVLALKTLNPSVKGPYFATNPWIGAALRLTGRKDFVVTGIYAEPTSLSWKILRRLIGSAPVISMSESEARPWNRRRGTRVVRAVWELARVPGPKAGRRFPHIYRRLI